MKILVIDDEPSFGALLGHTLKRLGHKPVVAGHPDDALALLDGDVDAVITDIDMPGMNGVELARRIRGRMPEMPVAFCTGSAPEGQTIRDAEQLGRVLPKVWTVADVKEVVEELSRARRGSRPARRRRSAVAELYGPATIREPAPGSGSRPAAEAAPGEPTAAAPPRRRARRRKARRVRLAFKSWQQVRKVADDAERGPVYVTVPGPADLDPGAPVTLSLALPGEITVRIAGVVQAIRPRAAGKPEIVIDLEGLDRATAARLRALADASAPADERPRTAYLRVSPTAAARRRRASGSEPPLARGSRNDLRVSELLQDNRRLREQIEGLASKMTPRPELLDE